jgi:tetratricopeptide (TPR) repeat protein
MVAHHYLNALELARAAGQDVEAIAERARVALREAGERAAGLHALEQGGRYYRDALALVQEGDPERPELLLRLGRVLYLRNEEGEPELTEARDALTAHGNREPAADASLMLADIAWKQGRRQDMLAHLETARSLVTGERPSRTQVAVLAEAARYEMLGDQLDTAIELAREALVKAEELGLDDLRAHALNTIGASRGDMGDPAGFADVEESIALAARGNFIQDLLRGHNNLSSLYLLHGEFERFRVGEAKTIELATHFGHLGQVRFMESGGAVGHRYLAGEWDEALARTEKVIAEAAEGARFYQVAAMHGFRGLIRLARGDDEGAESDAEQTVELARPVGDPQAVNPDLGMAAAIFLSVGNETRAGETLTEAIESLRRLRHLGFAVMEPYLGWVAVSLGREAELLAELERESFESPWLRVALAAAARDFRAAADVFDGVGIVAHEAFYRLRAAEQFVADGRRAEADEQLRPALAFYRSVGATRYVREGEALLAASA